MSRDGKSIEKARARPHKRHLYRAIPIFRKIVIGLRQILKGRP
jgi:hypothetical protein